MSNRFGGKLLILAVFLASSIACHEAFADLFYSVDMDTDELVTIDSSSGEVQTVGSLGRDFDNSDIALEIHEGKLYAVVGVFDVWRADLFEINRQTGEATFLAQLFDSGTQVSFAEALVSTPTGLRISYNTANQLQYVSTRLGDLALDGQVTGGVETGVDMDGIAILPDERLFTYDARTTGVFSFHLEPTEEIGNYDLEGAEPFDVDYRDGMIWGISPLGVVEINPEDGSLASLTSLSRSGDYSGFTAVPEPSSYLLCGAALIGCIALARKKSRKQRQA